tara:strand:- start:385 stop:837 length:453 start_codon:yes stop_codon:yes gene_type:complete
MNKIITYIAILLASTSLTMASNGITLTSKNITQVVENKTIVSATGLCNNNEVHFHLELINESDEVYFALKREYSDGRFETVKYIKVGQVNLEEEDRSEFKTIHDYNVPNEDFTYVLMRIVPVERAFSVIQRWDYCSDTQELCREGVLAVN